MSASPTGGGMRPWPMGRVLFVVLGAVWILLALVVMAEPLYPTLAVVVIFGVLLLIGGAAHTIHAFTVRSWRGFLFHLVEGLLYVVIGVMLVADPVRGAIGLTLLIGVFLMVGGVLRCILGFMLRQSGLPLWLVAGGVLELLLGAVILSGWPGSALWVIGLFLGIRMLFSGSTMIALGLSPRGTTAAV